MKRRDLLLNAGKALTIWLVGQKVVRPGIETTGDFIKNTAHSTAEILGINADPGMNTNMTIDELVFWEGRWDSADYSQIHEKLVKEIAEQLGAPEKNIHALLRQEWVPFFIGEGFGKDNGKPAILFERHVFWRSLPGDIQRALMDVARENGEDNIFLSREAFSREKYEYWKQSDQYERLRIVYGWANKYAREVGIRSSRKEVSVQENIQSAALSACSWWAGQILWENYRSCGYSSVEKLARNASSIDGMAKNFVAEIRSKPSLLKEIKKWNPNWGKIAISHNGSAVKRVNPQYIPNVQKYAHEYTGNALLDTKWMVIAGVAGILAWSAIWAGRKFLEKQQEKITRRSPKNPIRRRDFLRLWALGGIGGSMIYVWEKTLGRVGQILGNPLSSHWTHSARKEKQAKVTEKKEGSTSCEEKVQEYINSQRNAWNLLPREQEDTTWASYDLAQNKYSMSFNINTPMRAASMIKPFIILAWLLDKKNNTIPKSKQEQFESMILYNKQRNGMTSSWTANYYTTTLMNELWWAAGVTRILSSHGLPEEFIQWLSIVETIPTSGQTYNNTITTNALIAFYRHLYKKRKEAPYSTLLNLLTREKHDRIVDGTSIPTDIRLSNKSGSTGMSNWDAGIVWDKKHGPYIFVGMCSIKHKKDKQPNNKIVWRSKIIRNISQIAWNDRQRK